MQKQHVDILVFLRVCFTDGGGDLDDPNQYLKEEKILAFTKNGLRQVHKGTRDESRFVDSIQDHMLHVLPRMIRYTSPL